MTVTLGTEDVFVACSSSLGMWRPTPIVGLVSLLVCIGPSTPSISVSKPYFHRRSSSSPSSQAGQQQGSVLLGGRGGAEFGKDRCAARVSACNSLLPFFVGPLSGAERATALMTSPEPLHCRRRPRAEVFPLCAARCLRRGHAAVHRHGAAITMAASRRGQEQRGADGDCPRLSVGVPVPLKVWDKLLQIWIAGSNNMSTKVRMSARSPLMAISFPVQLAGQLTSSPQEEIDQMVARLEQNLRALAPFRLTLGKVDCVPEAGGGWSVVVEAAPDKGLVRLREQLSLLLPQTESTPLFAAPAEDGFVARLELANFRTRNEAYAARERFTSAPVPSSGAADTSDAWTALHGAALLHMGEEGAELNWDVNMVVMSLLPGSASREANAYYRIMSLGGAELQRCETEYQALYSQLFPPAFSTTGSKSGTTINILAASQEPDKDELRVLKQVMGEFDADLNVNSQVRLFVLSFFLFSTALHSKRTSIPCWLWQKKIQTSTCGPVE